MIVVFRRCVLNPRDEINVLRLAAYNIFDRTYILAKDIKGQTLVVSGTKEMKMYSSLGELRK